MHAWRTGCAVVLAAATALAGLGVSNARADDAARPETFVDARVRAVHSGDVHVVVQKVAADDPGPEAAMRAILVAPPRDSRGLVSPLASSPRQRTFAAANRGVRAFASAKRSVTMVPTPSSPSSTQS